MKRWAWSAEKQHRPHVYQNCSWMGLPTQRRPAGFRSFLFAGANGLITPETLDRRPFVTARRTTPTSYRCAVAGCAVGPWEREDVNPSAVGRGGWVGRTGTFTTAGVWAGVWVESTPVFWRLARRGGEAFDTGTDLGPLARPHRSF